MHFRFNTTCISIMLISCSVHAEQSLHIIPWPQSIVTNGGTLSLSPVSRLVVNEPALLPLAAVVSNELSLLFGLDCTITDTGTGAGDIQLALSAHVALTGEAYRVQKQMPPDR